MAENNRSVTKMAVGAEYQQTLLAKTLKNYCTSRGIRQIINISPRCRPYICNTDILTFWGLSLVVVRISQDLQFSLGA